MSEFPYLSASEIQESIDSRSSVFEEIQKQTVTEIEFLLRQYVGKAPETIEEGQAVCRTINDLVAAFGLRVKTIQMNEPSTLAYYRIGRTKAGAFVFTGMKDGKRTVTYGSTVLPDLKVVPASLHGRRHPSSKKKKR